MKKLGGRKLILASAAVLWLLAAAGAFAADKAALARTRFSPADPPRTLLTVKERGYYSLQAKSQTGTALELVDRMAGALGRSGEAGRTDGRVDLLLDPGQYRVNLTYDPAAKTPAELALLSFTDANAGATAADFPFLYDGESIRTFLKDLETRSYWIYLSERTELRLEAMGRSLQGCALWQNGQWLMPAEYSSELREPVKGRPMLSVEFHQTLEAGHYLLVCVGGMRRAWADEASETPLYLRRGVRFLGSNSVQKLRVSPFGRDAYLISGSADYIECVRDTLEPTRLAVGPVAEGNSRYQTSSAATITKESKEPSCRIQDRVGGDRQWLVVEAKPGDLLEVGFFKRSASVNLPYDKRLDKSYWVSTVSSIAGRDLIDLTPLVYYRDDKRIRLIQDGSVGVSGASPLVRKVNLMGACTVYLSIEEPGAYRIVEAAAADKTGAKARYRWSRLEDRFIGGTAGEWKTTEKAFPLVKGHYVLDFQPTSLGILHFALYKEGSQRPDELLKRTPPAPRHFASWPSVTVPARTTVTFIANARYDLALGVDVRELPLNLAAPLSVSLASGESIVLDVKAARDSVLSAEGDKYILTADGKTIESGAELSAGAHRLLVRNAAPDADLITLGLVDKLSLQRFPKPVLKSFEETFPLFTADRPYFADFERGQTRHVLLRVAEPALYRIETAGRLALGLAVRTPLLPSLTQASQNAAGRNALIQGYLRPGDYLVAVTAIGRSRGRAGVSLRKTPLTEEGALPQTVVSRKTVEADVGLRYALVAAAKARYSIASYGLGIELPFRLEDSEGFPLTGPGTTGVTIALDPGEYFYYSLPLPFLTRRLTSFNLVPEAAPPAAEGKRFTLKLNERREHVWKETAPRAADVFVCVLSAPLTVTVSLSAGMAGEISGQGLTPAVRLTGGREQPLELAAGSYELAVKAQEERNLYPYALAVTTDMLAAGLGYWIDPEAAEFVVSTAGDGVYDLSSYGTDDFKAGLWDEAGTRLIAENDDMESDWNFRITQRLPAGRYRLRIEPAGYVSGPALISMEANQEEALPEKKLPFTLDRTIGREIIKLPVRAEAEGVLAVKAEAGRAVKFGLYRESALLAEAEGFLAVPLVKGASYTLHVWQREDTPQRVKVTALLGAPQPVTLPAQPGRLDGPPFLALNNPAGLSYRIIDPGRELLFAPGPESPCLPVGSDPVAFSGERGYLVAPSGRPFSQVKVEPLTLEPGRKEILFLSASPHGFAFDAGGSDLCFIAADINDRACGLALAPRNAYQKTEFNFRGLDSSGNRSFALAIPGGGQYQGKVWDPEPGRAGERVSLLLRKMKTSSDSLRKGDVKTFTLEPGAGLRLILEGALSARLLLARFTAAALWKDNRPQAMAAADAANRDLEFAADGGTLALVNYGAAPALVRVEARDAAVPIVFDRNGLETTLPNEGRLLVRLSETRDKETLCLAGEGFSARLLAANGRIYRAAEQEGGSRLSMLPAEAGDLEIEYAHGFVKAFYAVPGREEAALSGLSSLSGARPMAGRQELKGKDELFSFSLSADGFIAVSTDTAGFIALCARESGNQASGVRVLASSPGFGPGERTIVRFLKRGEYFISSRPWKNVPQSGSLTLTRITPAALPASPPDRQYFIGRGEVQVFQFRVKEAGLVGVGLAAEADKLRSELYDAGSELLGAGGLLFRTLEPGAYYLVVYGAALPVRYAPVIYGQDGSAAGVPPDVIDQYKTPKEGEE